MEKLDVFTKNVDIYGDQELIYQSVALSARNGKMLRLKIKLRNNYKNENT